MRLRELLVACSLFALAPGRLPPPARAQEPAPAPAAPGYDATQAQRLFGDLMSPFCPGLTLATCPSPGADSLRRDIRMRLALGETPRAVRAAYAATWGEEILGAPRWRGWGIALWTMPLLVLVIGGALLVRWLLRMQRLAGGGPATGPAAAAPAHPLDEGDRRRLEEALAAFEDHWPP